MPLIIYSYLLACYLLATLINYLFDTLIFTLSFSGFLATQRVNALNIQVRDRGEREINKFETSVAILFTTVETRA